MEEKLSTRKIRLQRYLETSLEKEYQDYINKKSRPADFNSVVKYNQDLSRELIELSQKLDGYYTNPENLQRLSFIFREKEIQLCHCGNPKSWRDIIKGYNKTCGNKECVAKANVESVKKHTLNKYGVEHLFQTEEFKEKFKKNSLEKYGVDNPAKSQHIIEKGKQKNLEKYGADSWLKIKENKEQISNKLKKRNELIRNEKILGNKIPIKILEFSNGSDVNILCETCGLESTFSNSFLNKKIILAENPCLNCNPPEYSTSKAEKELMNFIEEIYDGEILIHDRNIAEGKEIDIFLPDKNIAYEFSGTYWHSELFKSKKYHLEKKEIIEKKGIDLYNIWEDDWIYKKEIIKSRIKNSLGLSVKIYARKCIIKEISTIEEREFLEKNHLQGYVASKIKIGLFYNNELLSIMSFGKQRVSLGKNPVDGEYEILRFCNLLNTTVVGGSSKIFHYFLQKYNPKKIISYQDNSWHAGNLYKNLGFIKIDPIKLDYFWCKGNIRYHRYNFRKSKLIEEGFDPNKTEDQIMSERKYYKLWGFGNLKWELIPIKKEQ